MNLVEGIKMWWNRNGFLLDLKYPWSHTHSLVSLYNQFPSDSGLKTFTLGIEQTN